MAAVELKNTKTEYHAQVKIASADVDNQIESEIAKIAKTAKIDGFRVGKVPVSMVKKKYYSSVRADVVREKIGNAIEEIVKDKKLNIATDPAVEDLKNDEGKDLECVLKFEIVPEIKLPDFKKIELEKPALDAKDKDIKEQLDQLASFSKNYEKETKGKAKKGDQVTIDAVGYVDGKAFDGGKLEAHKLVLGSNAFIPGFEDQLIGTKAGDDVSVNVEFPKEYHSTDLAGKPSEFKVQVLAVHQESIQELDDEFAKKFQCKSMDELKEKMSDNLKKSFEQSIHVLMKMRLFDKLENTLDFDVPASLLARELEALEKQGDQMKDDEELKNKSDAEKKKYFEGLAQRRVRIGLMLAEYVKQNKIQIEEADIREAILAQARNYPGQEQQVIDFYMKNKQAIENLKGPVLEEKAVKVIFDKEVKLKEKLYTKEKLEKLLNSEIKD